MISLLNQLKNELTTLFFAREDSYKNTIVKKAYEPLPKGQYPRVTIEEITNNSVIEREDSRGERSTRLGYQITCYSREMEENNAVDSVMFMIKLIDDYLKTNQTFSKMSRISTTGARPYIVDDTVMTNISRYTCIYDEETNLIYIN